MRLIIVIKESIAADANRVASEVDIEGGMNTFTVRLADSTDPATVTHRWCNWGFDATKHDWPILRQKIEEFGVSARASDPPDKDRMVNVFDVEDWTLEQVLEALGLIRYETGTP